MVGKLKQNRWLKSLAKLRKENTKSIYQELSGNGYNYEAAEVVKCLQAGKLESDLMPLSETIEIMETMEQLLTQWHQG